MQNRKEFGKKALIGVENNMSQEGEKYHFQKGGAKIMFLDQNIEPWFILWKIPFDGCFANFI
jgi:hypothetical protein